MSSRFAGLLAAVALAVAAVTVFSALPPGVQAQGNPQEQNAEVVSLNLACHTNGNLYLTARFASFVALDVTNHVTQMANAPDCSAVLTTTAAVASPPVCTTHVSPSATTYVEMSIVCAGTRTEVVDTIFNLTSALHDLAGS